jgi:hypothetical protein
MLLIAESMPATSEMVPLIEIYLTIVMALTSLSIVLTVYVLQLHHSGPVVIPISHSFKYSLVRCIAPVIGMKKIVEIYAREHNLIDTDDVYRCFAKTSTRSTDSPIANHKKKISNLFDSFHITYLTFLLFSLEINYRKESLYDEEYNDNDEEETMKEFLPRSSIGNGDIRLTSIFNKSPPPSPLHHHHHHHHSRSRRVPPIVLVPQQSTSTSSPILNNSHPHYTLFNSNMYLLEKHLKHLINKQKLEEDRNEIINEWKLMALIMDRLLFWLFTFFTILSTVLCLIIIPLLKNSGYIPALSKELVREYKSTEAVANVIEEQLKINLTGLSTVET